MMSGLISQRTVPILCGKGFFMGVGASQKKHRKELVSRFQLVVIALGDGSRRRGFASGLHAAGKWG